MFRGHWNNRLWSIVGSFKSWGIRTQIRMTVIRLSDQSLFLHSPVGLTKQLEGRLEVLGPVRHISVPNKFHHPFLEDYRRVYPDAKIYAPPGLVKKRKALYFDGILRDFPEPSWKGDLDQAIFQGAPILEEVVFFHPMSQTLIVGDLGRIGTAFFLRGGLFNRRAARRCLQNILDWDFKRIIPTHGEILEQNGKDRLCRIYAWLL